MLTLALMLLSAAPTPTRAERYEQARANLESKRLELARAPAAQRRATRASARAELLRFFDEEALPAWSGTPWAFYGTSTVPGEGTIACGYLVSTVLLHAGVKVERVRLAQQASSWIVTTLARGSKVERLTPTDNAAALEVMKAKFPNAQLLVVGFDYHVGFVRLTSERAQFCHSSYLEPGSVTCEDPVASGAFASKLYVVGDALSDTLVDDWLAGRAIPTQRPGNAN